MPVSFNPERGQTIWADDIDALIAVANYAESTAEQARAKADAALTPTSGAAVFAPAAAAKLGNRFVFLGDSITRGSDTPASQHRGVSWPNVTSLASGGKVEYVHNAGIAGNKTAEMLARFDTDVTPYTPNVVALLCGTNDLPTNAGVTFEAWTRSVEDIVAKIRGIGATPVLGTLPPTNTAAYKVRLGRFNGWLRRYAAAQRITLVDFYTVLAEPTTGDYRTAFYNDGVHPNTAGTNAMGHLAAKVLSALVPNTLPEMVSDDKDHTSGIWHGCFGGYTGSTLPTGWVDNAGVPTGSVLSYTTDAEVPGQMVTLTHSAATGARQLSYLAYIGATTVNADVAAGSTSIVTAGRADRAGVLFIGSGSTFEIAKIVNSSGGGPQTQTLAAPLLYNHAAGEAVVANCLPGDEVIFSGVVDSDGGCDVSVATQCTGASYSPQPMVSMPTALTRGVFYQRLTVPASTTTIGFRLTLGTGTGVVKFGRITFKNATRLGI